MNKSPGLVAIVAFTLSLAAANAQSGPRGNTMGGLPAGPRLSGSMAKLFGDNSGFSGTLEMQTVDNAKGQPLTLPGKIAFAGGKSRFEMDLSQAKGGNMSPETAAHMKTMGMDNVVLISRPDKKLAYQIFPGMQAYLENPIQEPEAFAPPESFKIETTELGKETVDGHPCVKNKATVTDDKGARHESTVWNATDLKSFPIKIETAGTGNTVTMLFKDVKLAKPDDASFSPPSDFKGYDSMMALMREEMMKRMGGGMGIPPVPGR